MMDAILRRHVVCIAVALVVILTPCSQAHLANAE